MRCSSPISLQNPASAAIQRVPCGQCICCRVNRTQEWATRIMHESKGYNSSLFVTLTYSPENLPENGSLVKSDLQNFMKRLRKRRLCRYFACGEYGERYARPHFHLIIFGLYPEDRRVIESCWKFGLVHVGSLTLQSAQYCAKYVQKQLSGPASVFYQEKNLNREFALMSRRPGVGLKFAEKYVEDWVKNGYIIINGNKRSIPRAYLSRLSDARRLEFSRIRSAQASLRLEAEAAAARVPEYKIIEQEVRQRNQRVRNLNARFGLKSNKL